MADTSYTARDWSTQPAYIHPAYKSTPLRGPTKPLVVVPQSLSELTGPVYGHDAVGAMDADLTKNAAKNGEVLGERIIVTGRVLDDSGRPQPNTLIEIWQCNAAGRYNHVADQHDAPLDPNFLGAGRCVTDANGVYKFYTIRPGAYPWPNHPNAWRPAHIHFSLFGPAFVSRLVTQSYFEGDPLCAYDPIYKSSPEGARELLVKKFSMDDTEEGYAIAYRFDFVLRGPKATPMEADLGEAGR